MRSRLIVLLLFIASVNNIYSKENIDSLYNVLNSAIENRQVYVEQKRQRIGSYKNILKDPANHNFNIQDELLNKLYNEYQSFNYDSAFTYALRLQNNAYASKNKKLINKSRIKVGFSLLSAGLFKETLDTLDNVSLKGLSDTIKLEYYSLLARTYFDMADYTGDSYFAPLYNKKGKQMLDSAIRISPRNSQDYLHHSGLKCLREGDVKKAREIYEKLLSMPGLDGHQYAIEASSLSFIYRFDNEPVLAEEMIVKAAIADLMASTKETVAIRQLAELVYKQGNVNKAYTYVKVALDDAYFYGARHRKIQISDILPSIEDRQLDIVQKQRRTFLIYSVSVSILSILVILFIVIIFRQLKSLRKAKKYLSESNKKLSDINRKLSEANLIKEEYIGHFFDTISNFINRFEKLKVNINRKITTHQIDDIREIVSAIDIKREREDLYNDFDTTFLRIFPDFIDDFNSFLKEEKINTEGLLLPPEVRIYALIRLGISDNDKIARFLGYSLNTIYAYKTKIKNRLSISMDEFDKRLMKIKTMEY